MNNSLFGGIVWVWCTWECDGIRISREILRMMVLVNVRTWGLILMATWRSYNH